MMKYFKNSFLSLILGLILAFFIGHYYSGSVTGGLQALFVATVLVILEISLSFDNAIVNAVVIKKMTPIWKQRFLTWGILIAVFGMRLLFPLLIVSLIGRIGPIEALLMAIEKPHDYAQMMLSAHLEVSAFGGAFLMMVALKYFYDENKDLHWISFLEKPVAQLGKIEAIEVGLTLIMLVFLTGYLESADQLRFLVAGLFGIISFIAVDSLGTFLEGEDEQLKDLHKASLGLFLYLEVLDASFSFDGVIGAFAITNNLFIIMIGLGVGAFFVRSLTVLFVEKETLRKFAYLEHGAFYAIGSLASLMLLDPFMHIPEWITGLIGGIIIIASFFWSIKFAPKDWVEKNGGT